MVIAPGLPLIKNKIVYLQQNSKLSSTFEPRGRKGEALKGKIMKKNVFATVNGRRVDDCHIVDATTVYADGTLFQGVIEDYTIPGYVKITDYATGDVLVFNAAEAGVLGVDYYEAAGDNPGSHPVNTTLWRLSEEIATTDFNAIAEMMVRVHHNTPGSFLEVDEGMGMTHLWLWSDAKRSLLLRQVVANFPVKVPAEAAKA